VQLVYLAVLVPMGAFCSRFPEISRFVKEAYRKFEEAGRLHVKVPFPASVETILLTGTYAAHVMRGELDDPGVALRMERDKELLDFTQHNMVLILGQYWEACWEPRCSRRVSHWNEKLAELSSLSNKAQVIKAMQWRSSNGASLLLLKSIGIIFPCRGIRMGYDGVNPALL